VLKPVAKSIVLAAIWGALSFCSHAATAADPPRTGPATEQRFPPLKVPPGFRATLFACDPLIEYPSAIALGPRPGSLFVAADYMTGLGTEIIRRDEIRLLEDTDGDGYADKSTTYAGQFNSIEGLTFHAGTVYAMHAPLLTALRDADGDGIADERRDIVIGLGLTPEDNPFRLHSANGLVMGHDGWLYLALGDHGCDVARPEGDRLAYGGGGILRCRPDGRDLHVFASGLRNIYDVALDAELNVFVRDNENDGGDYKIRVCHSFFGADHGYPYLYYERPDEALPPIADLGLGSSAGGACYLEQQFPAEYRGNLFFCEWGRSVVHYRPQMRGAQFAPVEELEFARGAENDPYGLKPTDLVVERDGSLIVADWADGQRPQRGRGRIYRIQHSDAATHVAPANRERAPIRRELVLPDNVSLSLPDAITQLDSTSYYKRIDAQESIVSKELQGFDGVVEAFEKGRMGINGRLHAVWIIARAGGESAREKLYTWAKADTDVRVQVQAIRSLADLEDPVFVRHRLDASPGSADTAARLAKLADGKDPRVLFETVVAVGRLGWSDAPAWIQKVFTARQSADGADGAPDPFLAHAAQQTLRKSGNWPAVVKLLDLPIGDPLRTIALQAIADQPVAYVAGQLIERLDSVTAGAKQDAGDFVRRSEYADALTRIYKKAGPWVYWGYRPAPRPANTVAWERTAAIEQTLDRVLTDADHTLRLVVLRRMLREKIPTRLATIAAWLDSERDSAAVAVILESLREHPPAECREVLARLIAEPQQAPANRLTALGQMTAGVDEASAGRLLELAGAVEDGPVAAELIRQLGRHPRLNANTLLLAKLKSTATQVRTAAVDSLAELRIVEAGMPIRTLLDDREPLVRRAAALAAGRLADRGAVEQLLRLAQDDEPAVRRASLESLRVLGEGSAVPLAVAALANRETQTAALTYLGEFGGPDQAQSVIELASGDPTAEVVQLVAGLLTKWSLAGERQPARQLEFGRAVAEMQGRSGLLVRWQVEGPLAEASATPLLKQMTMRSDIDVLFDRLSAGRTMLAAGLESRLALPDRVSPVGSPAPAAPPPVGADRIWLAAIDLIVPEATPVQFLGSASGKFQIWVNGRMVFARDQVRPFQADSDRFDGTFEAGVNRVVVRVAAPRDSAEMHLHFRRKSSTAEQEQFVQAALARPGDAERGRKLFFDVARVQCSKCHRIGDQGERIGPELTGVGDRFSRIHIVESILEPSRTVTPGFQTITVALRDGRVLAGIKIAETDGTLTLGDNQGQKHELAKAQIEEQTAQTQSTMPDGLAKQLTPDQFVDLVAFLTSQKAYRGANATR
jgi:putative membrane-bound dehydrogenase-like protein